VKPTASAGVRRGSLLQWPAFPLSHALVARGGRDGSDRNAGHPVGTKELEIGCAGWACRNGSTRKRMRGRNCRRRTIRDRLEFRKTNPFEILP
jgi:hypothetical protein